jgi:hypothetical protein
VGDFDSPMVVLEHCVTPPSLREALVLSFEASHEPPCVHTAGSFQHGDKHLRGSNYLLDIKVTTKVIG